MKFSSELKQAKLIKRYKRFLADVELPDKSVRTIHVSNTGSMTGCGSIGDTIWYSTSDNVKRKYPNSWELTEKPNGSFICVNTIKANQLVEEALNNKIITELNDYSIIKREVKYGSENSKIDFLLLSPKQSENLPDAYVEVKSVTLLENGQGFFPDTTTLRGQKHLRELSDIAKSGDRAILLFAVLHTGIKSVKAAKHIDKKYNDLLEKAIKNGVEVLVYHAEISPSKMEIAYSSIFKVQ